ncbi:MAG: transglutaminase family protein [Chthoniobacteraceae bacterium]|jgi:transglutaminase-like putative cysteine protease
MEFKITHTTTYLYGNAAAEAYGEARLTPPDLPTQKVLKHKVSIEPPTRTSSYTDHFGNRVDFFSLPFRHQKLVVSSQLLVKTTPPSLPSESLEVTVGEARQIFSSALPDVFEYLQPTDIVKTGNTAVQWSRRYLRGELTLAEGLTGLNEAIHDSFDYIKGVTENSTELGVIWRNRKGVCQDFVHVALSVLRTAGLPARYVCGYIEAVAPRNEPGKRKLVGAYETHAWVEALVPGMLWVALDPTNRQWCNDRYVAVSYGRDASDAAPLRGTFKGSGGQKLSAKVLMTRMNG